MQELVFQEEIRSGYASSPLKAAERVYGKVKPKTSLYPSGHGGSIIFRGPVLERRRLAGWASSAGPVQTSYISIADH